MHAVDGATSNREPTPMNDRPEVGLLSSWITSHEPRRFGQVLIGPMRRRHRSFGVVTFEPRAPGGPFLYLSTRLTRGRIATSFLALSNHEDGRHVRLLTMLAWRHVEGSLPALDEGALVPVGAPWLPQSALSWVLISPPYPLGDQWPACAAALPGFRLWWAQPISAQEARFAHVHGVDALRARFRAEGIQVADGRRASVV